MVRQIEVDRVVLRLRDAGQLSLGRINLTIAHLHGVSDVRKRENPFRPYLVARALYEAMRNQRERLSWQRPTEQFVNGIGGGIDGADLDYILHDELLPPAMHRQPGRLHMPFLRAAVLEPFLLHEADHPARALFDRAVESMMAGAESLAPA